MNQSTRKAGHRRSDVLEDFLDSFGQYIEDPLCSQILYCIISGQATYTKQIAERIGHDKRIEKVWQLMRSMRQDYVIEQVNDETRQNNIKEYRIVPTFLAYLFRHSLDTDLPEDKRFTKTEMFNTGDFDKAINNGFSGAVIRDVAANLIDSELPIRFLCMKFAQYFGQKNIDELRDLYVDILKGGLDPETYNFYMKVRDMHQKGMSVEVDRNQEKVLRTIWEWEMSYEKLIQISTYYVTHKITLDMDEIIRTVIDTLVSRS